MSRQVNRQILVHMENFSTPRRALVPWTTNLVTLAVLAYTTWWSNGQRPPDSLLAAGRIASAAPAVKAAATGIETPKPTQAVQPSATATVAWPPAAAAPVQRDGLQTVGFSPELAQ